jgi:hypothetical protein
MDEAWFTEFADELARCLVDARACAETCEAFLASEAAQPDDVRRLAAPAAVSRVLIELIDHPPELVLAAVRLCRDLTSAAAREVAGPQEVATALRTVAASSGAFVEAAR